MQIGWRHALFGLSGHTLGASLGLALQTRRRWARAVAPLVGLGLAIAAHAVNNALPLVIALSAAAAGDPPSAGDTPPDVGLVEAWVGGTIADLTIFLPFVALLAVLLWRSGVRERRVIREELADEIGPALTAAEYAAVRRDGIFRTRRRIVPAHRAILRALVNAQHELAFRKCRAREEARDPEADPPVQAWREEIALPRERA